MCRQESLYLPESVLPSEENGVPCKERVVHIDITMPSGAYGRLLIRADANTRVGIGHVMRCLSLAQAWQDAGGHAIFVMSPELPGLEATLKSDGMEVVHLLAPSGETDDAIETANLARQADAAWVVLDGYHFNSEYQRIMNDSGLRLLLVDDTGNHDHYYARIVLNQNLHAREGLYRHKESYTQLLLGTRYALLRREFLKWREERREIPEVAHRLLITLGGGEQNEVILKVIHALRQVKGLEALVLLGGRDPDSRKLESHVDGALSTFRIVNDLASMPERMAWADMALSAGGSTCWELAFMGLPSLVLVLAENQRPVAESLESRGVALNLGWHTLLSEFDLVAALSGLIQDYTRRRQMSERGRQLVDGQGAARVVSILRRETSRT
jgi:UDP-2,4-diacetamido-2,4,6-trideoxy-beta-L-altropyranose hydrolase